jgi:hypothetical protein
MSEASIDTLLERASILSFICSDLFVHFYVLFWYKILRFVENWNQIVSYTSEADSEFT